MVRTRFAPSPTGFMHVGNLRTGLFAWLTARHAGGDFILRLEDTDKNREVEGSADHILECLNMLGLERDEGIDVGGPYAPYMQSERLAIYREWAQRLIDTGRAYADPYTAEQVQQFREQAQAEKRPFLYRNHRPENPPTWDGTTPLRFKSEPKSYEWHDEVMGDLHAGAEVVDDFILIKSDGYPTYNFAHIVDDAAMQVTHVIRGQEFISSMPNYLNLYEALGLELPIFATMPHILNENGNKKLGKRDGAKDVLEYVREGYLPETLLSFIATLGWNDGTEQELFTRQELIEKFTLDRVQHSGARFDEKRLLWMNGQFIRQLSLDDLWNRVVDFWPEGAENSNDDYRRQVLALAQDRLKTLHDLPTLTSYFFAEPTPDWSMIDDNKQLSKIDRGRLVELLGATKSALESSDFSADALQQTLNNLLEQTGEKPGTLFSLIRFAITWAPFSPALPETMEVLGRDRTLQRLQSAIDAA
ncbi:MAG: nondiscriminating glutamyl-tRNA synthetase [Patescibacteria group bacterium]|nr:nondiscriminating glutamyl-tRNA synthetase [Patescibacteria group bacterium]